MKSYISKYHTPRVFQVFVTVFFIAAPILMAVLRSVDRTVLSLSHVGRYSFPIFDMYGYGADVIVFGICFVIPVIGIVFIWMNRPRISAICASAFLMLMISSLFILTLSGDPKKYKYFEWGNDFVMYQPNYQYYILWAVTIGLITFSVLAIISTKPGKRPTTVVREETPVLTDVSSADEIKKYKELYDEGVISKEEFEAKKKQLLRL